MPTRHENQTFALTAKLEADIRASYVSTFHDDTVASVSFSSTDLSNTTPPPIVGEYRVDIEFPSVRLSLSARNVPPTGFAHSASTSFPARVSSRRISSLSSVLAFPPPSLSLSPPLAVAVVAIVVIAAVAFKPQCRRLTLTLRNGYHLEAIARDFWPNR